MASIKCGHCGQTHSTVAEVRSCAAVPASPVAHRVAVTIGATSTSSSFPAPAPQPVSDATINPASPKQVAFLTTLAAERGEIAKTGLSKRGASLEIERLLALPKVAPAAAAKSVAFAARTEPVDGIYISKGQDGKDDVYKVYKMVHGSGRQGVKRLVVGSDSGSFEYLGLASRCLPADARKMTLEEAKKFGALYGFCVRCGRTLTDEESIAAGIGPKCGGREW